MRFGSGFVSRATNAEPHHAHALFFSTISLRCEGRSDEFLLIFTTSDQLPPDHRVHRRVDSYTMLSSFTRINDTYLWHLVSCNVYPRKLSFVMILDLRRRNKLIPGIHHSHSHCIYIRTHVSIGPKVSSEGPKIPEYCRSRGSAAPHNIVVVLDLHNDETTRRT